IYVYVYHMLTLDDQHFYPQKSIIKIKAGSVVYNVSSFFCIYLAASRSTTFKTISVECFAATGKNSSNEILDSFPAISDNARITTNGTLNWWQTCATAAASISEAFIDGKNPLTFSTRSG